MQTQIEFDFSSVGRTVTEAVIQQLCRFECYVLCCWYLGAH